jgi:hypothetical protein
MQVYLPPALYKEVKAKRLHASELLQQAVRAELKRLELLANTDRYLKKLVAKVGMPTSSEQSRARALASRIALHTASAGATRKSVTRKAG